MEHNNDSNQEQLPNTIQKRHVEFLSRILPLCECMTKTPEWSYHDEQCPHRMMKEIVDSLREIVPDDNQTIGGNFYHLESHQSRLVSTEIINSKIKRLEEELEKARNQLSDAGWQLEASRQRESEILGRW